MNSGTIDDFALTSKKFLRYGLWKPQVQNGLGSVLILPDYGVRIEDMADLIARLNARGFCAATFEWFARDDAQGHFEHDLPAPMDDFRLNLQNLRAIFAELFLPSLPAPFYGLGIGLGGVLGLAAHPILQSQMRRMVLVSPLFAPFGHKAGGLFHTLARFMGDLGLSGWRTNQPLFAAYPHIYPTLGCYQGMLDAAQLVLSPAWRDKISIPLLCVLSQADRLSDPAVARHFCENLRSASAITLHHSNRLSFEGDTPQAQQFWRGFDAFIPGTGAPDPERSLEEGLLL